MPIRLDAMSLFKELKYKKIFCKQIMRAWGIEKGTNVTEKFAHRFFADFGDSGEGDRDSGLMVISIPGSM
jgi:hypothetical protein